MSLTGSTDPATPVLNTERFVLRPIEPADAAALFPTLSDEAQCRYLTRAAFATIKELEAWLFDPDWDGRTWIATDRTDGAAAARLVAVPVAQGVAEIGYITVKQHQGHGIAGECAAAMITHLFGAEQLHLVTAETDPRNTASNALLERLGFTRKAHLRRSVQTHIGWCDELKWELRRCDWSEQ